MYRAIFALSFYPFLMSAKKSTSQEVKPKRAKTGGRAKGTANKVSSLTKSVIADLLDGYNRCGQMAKDFDALEPKERLLVAEKLMQYVLPKMQTTAVELSSSNETLSIEQRLIELSKEE